MMCHSARLTAVVAECEGNIGELKGNFTKVLNSDRKWVEQDEEVTARSLPLGSLDHYCAGKKVVIAGIFAPVLAPHLPGARIVDVFVPGTLAEVISSPCDPAHGARRVERTALAACLPTCDVLVVSDAGWAEAIVGDAAYLAALASKVRDRIVLPFNSSPLIAACRWVSGHSWVESSGSNIWIWANSKESLMEAEIRLLRPPGDAMALKFHIMTRPDGGGDLAINVGGQSTVVQAPSEWITVPVIADTPRIPVSWRADIPALVMSHDARQLSFGLCDLHLIGEDGAVLVPAADFMQASAPDIATPRAARSALHVAGFTHVNSLASSSDGNRRERFVASSSIMPEGLDCVDDDHGSAAPILVGKGEIIWLFASKSLTIAPIFGNVYD
jgi:hypothetical protein